MKRTVGLALLLGLTWATFSVASERIQLPMSLKCNELLSAIPAEFFKSNYGAWPDGMSGTVTDVLVGNTRGDRSFVKFKISNPNIYLGNLEAATRLDALLLKYDLLFKPGAIISATVGSKATHNDNYVRAKIETANAAENNENPEFVGSFDSAVRYIQESKFELNEKTRYLTIQSWRDTNIGERSLDLTVNSNGRSLLRLKTEADGLIFLAAKRLKLPVRLVTQDTPNYNEPSRYTAVAGFPKLGSRYELRAFDIREVSSDGTIEIGRDYKVVGIEQYRASNNSKGHTEFTVERKRDKLYIKLISRTFDDGLLGIERLLSPRPFKLKIEQFESEDQNDSTPINRFEVVNDTETEVVVE